MLITLIPKGGINLLFIFLFFFFNRYFKSFFSKPLDRHCYSQNLRSGDVHRTVLGWGEQPRMSIRAGPTILDATLHPHTSC